MVIYRTCRICKHEITDNNAHYKNGVLTKACSNCLEKRNIYKLNKKACCELLKEKCCSNCLRILNTSNIHINKDGTIGKICKKCFKHVFKEKTPEQINKKHKADKEYRKKCQIKNTVMFLYKTILRNSRQRELVANISIEEIKEVFDKFIIDNKCGICGKICHLWDPIKLRKDCISIDRINNDLHYVSGNIALICLECNRKKSGFSPEQRIRLIKLLQNKPIYNIKYRTLTHEFVAAKLHRIRSRAQSRNIEFELLYDDIKTIFENSEEICPICNINMIFDKVSQDDVVSIDRLNNNVGYKMENIIIMCKRCNMLKNSASLEENIKFSKYEERNCVTRVLG